MLDETKEVLLHLLLIVVGYVIVTIFPILIAGYFVYSILSELALCR